MTSSMFYSDVFAILSILFPHKMHKNVQDDLLNKLKSKDTYNLSIDNPANIRYLKVALIHHTEIYATHTPVAYTTHVASQLTRRTTC